MIISHKENLISWFNSRLASEAKLALRSAKAYAESGDIAETQNSYQKSIELNPDNHNGKDWLKKLSSEKE